MISGMTMPPRPAGRNGLGDHGPGRGKGVPAAPTDRPAAKGLRHNLPRFGPVRGQSRRATKERTATQIATAAETATAREPARIRAAFQGGTTGGGGSSGSA